MSIKKQQQQELKLIDEALKIGPQSDRRRFFVSAAAFGAASAVAPLFANAQSAPGASPAPAAAARKALLKDDSRLLNIGATVIIGTLVPTLRL